MGPLELRREVHVERAAEVILRGAALQGEIALPEEGFVFGSDARDGRAQYQAAHAAGIHEGHGLGDDPAQREAHHVAAIDPEVIEKGHEILDIAAELVAALDLRRLPEAAEIVPQRPVPRPELLE